VSRIQRHPASPVRLATIASAGAAAALLAIAIAGCGSSEASSRPSASSVLGSAVHQDCTAVTDVLANGPDPDADPVGYAQAQVLPLQQLKISDAALSHDVLALARAYQAFSAGSGSGSHAAAAAVTKAEKSVDSICPQAAS
jgi:hypothetical protein